MKHKICSGLRLIPAILLIAGFDVLPTLATIYTLSAGISPLKRF